MKKPVIDQDLCLHCGTCCFICPKVFSQKQPGSVPSVQEMDDYSAFAPQIEQAINACPGVAISWESGDDGSEKSV
ncbi:MAG: ferredoxin [Patescibacteria group bacterium]|nr:ferredoxin [Patescibacteria group bacterium]